VNRVLRIWLDRTFVVEEMPKDGLLPGAAFVGCVRPKPGVGAPSWLRIPSGYRSRSRYDRQRSRSVQGGHAGQGAAPCGTTPTDDPRAEARGAPGTRSAQLARMANRFALARARSSGFGWLGLTWVAASAIACSPADPTGPAYRAREGFVDATLGEDVASMESGVPLAEPAAADGGSLGPVTCTWTPGEHASACPTTTCPIVEDVNVTCTDDHFSWPGLRVAPAPTATWLITASQNERYAFSIQNGSGTRSQGLPDDFADQTMWLALSPEGQPVVATDTQRFVNAPDGGYVAVGGTQYEALGPQGWLGWVVQPAPGAAPVVGLQVASDGTPNVWVGAPPRYQRVVPGDGGSIVQSAPVPGNNLGLGDNRFTLARNGEPVSFDIVASPGPGVMPPFQLHAFFSGVDRPIGAADVDGSTGIGPYTVADFPAPSQPDAGALAAAAILEGDGVHVAWLDATSWAETVVPSTAPFAFTCVVPPNTPCPSDVCHETGSGTLVQSNGQGDSETFALARTSDGVAWLAYLVTQYDEQVRYAPAVPTSSSSGGGDECATVVDSGGSSRTLHVARIPLDGSPSSDVLTLPVANPGAFANGYNANSAEAVTARLFDARAFGTDLAIGFQTTSNSGADTVRVLRIDTTLLATSPAPDAGD
jgi:hypothetical protein